MEAKADYLFEVSWEICNKVGGIYTVVTSKIIPIMRFYKDRYYTIGPFFPNGKITDQFTEHDPPDFLKKSFEQLNYAGIKCHTGKWNVEGHPNVILVDYSGFTYKNNDLKADYWDKFQIDSLNTFFHDFDEPMIWSTAVGMLLEKIKENLPHQKIVAHFHEWLAGGGLLYLRANKIKIATVFTTHATILGRTLASSSSSLYTDLHNINPKDEAYKHNIQAKHLMEKACAVNTDIFSTVSEITGIEATHFLGKKPDILLPNGLDIERFPTFDDVSIKHKQLKEKAKRFLMYYFFPYYQFDLENSLIFFLAGRYEFRDKGIDVFLRALKRLKDDMKNCNKTVIAFIFVPAGTTGIRKEILENKTYFEDIEDAIEDISDDVRAKLVYGILAKSDINKTFLFGQSFINENEKKLARFCREGNPPLCTHYLEQEDNDEIMKCLKELNLNNGAMDKVKVIFYPIYLTGADQLLDLSYYEALMAGHLGVFPSYYEPWGYTPLETGALGVASVTSDLAGFGRYIQKHNNGRKNPGIYVIERQNKTDEEVVSQLVDVFNNFCSGNKQDRIENKLRAKRLADLADWNLLVDYYIKAHNLALEKL